MLASGMEVGINEGYEKLDELLADGPGLSAWIPPRSTAGSPAGSPSASRGRRLGRPRAGRRLGRA